MAKAVSDYENIIEFLKYEVWKAARDGQAPRIVDLLANVRRGSLVDEILNHWTEEDGQSTTPLIIATIKGHEMVVDVLLIFGVEIDQKGTVHDGDTKFRGATALWCAALRGYYNIVNVLVVNGADVNHPTETGSTPLRPACYDGRFSIVQYLVEHGANVNAANNQNHTVLMLACYQGYYDVVQYLLEKGADPECEDLKGVTALHESAGCGHFSISKLLIETGLTMTKDTDGMTPLMMAAINGKRETVEYLASLPECQREDQIDALELLGTAFLFKTKSSISEAYHYFEKAMQARYKYPDEIIKKRFVSMTSLITGTAECQSMNELGDIKYDELALSIEATSILERILGPGNKEIHYPIMSTGAMFADLGIHDKCANLWLFALNLNQCIDEKFEVDWFPELFADMFYHGTKVNFSCLLEVFEGTVTETKLDEKRIQNDDENTKLRENYDKDILVCIYLVGVMLLTYKSKEEKYQLHQAVYNFLRKKIRLQNGFTPLHMCCDSVTNDNQIKMKNIILFPNSLICKTLVACGADANAQDENKNTPLHVIAKCDVSDVSLRKIITCLIEHGAHVDACNNDGDTAVDVAATEVAESTIKAHMKLRLDCLAARTVMRHKVKYQDIIPVSLQEFVELH